MATTHPAARVGIFIDVQNIYHSAKNLHGSRVNFRELIRAAVGNRTLARALAYVVKSEGIVPENEVHGEAAFFDVLREAGLELRQKDLQVYAGGSKKADWDVGLAVDAIRLAGTLDVVILVTGDGDFVPLVEYLKQGLGRQVEVVAFGRATTGKLRDVADRFVDLDTAPRLLLKIRQGALRTARAGSGGGGRSAAAASPPRGPKSPHRGRQGLPAGRQGRKFTGNFNQRSR